MRNAGLDEAQAGIKIAERNINNLRLCKSLYAKFQKYPNLTKQRGTKEHFDEGERGD